MIRPADFLWGAFSRYGVLAIVVTCVLDQASKYWLLSIYGIAERGRAKILPGVDFVLTWNTGISYGLFPQDGPAGQWGLLGLKLVAVLLLWMWLSRLQTRLSAVALGLIIGGAFGNIIDRLVHGAVVDFVLLHVTTARFNFNWYVFNLADVAIVAGVVGLLYDTFLGADAVKAP